MTRFARLAILWLTLLLAAACVADDATADAQAGHAEAVAADISLSELPLTDSEVTVAVANSAGTLQAGQPQRLMTALIDPSGSGYLGSDADPVDIVVSPLDSDDPGLEQHLQAEFLSADGADLGLYLSRPTFDAAGVWEIRVESLGRDIGGALIEVLDRATVPQAGSTAPLSANPTVKDAFDLSAISTDPDPDPDFYRATVAEAVANGRPTVVAFATPAFCQTALCGPTMEMVKGAVAGREGLDVVHVEPFDLDEARNRGNLVPVPAMSDWRLPSEPWVFVIDSQGTVQAGFEGIFTVAELNEALDAVGG